MAQCCFFHHAVRPQMVVDVDVVLLLKIALAAIGCGFPGGEVTRSW